MNEEHGILEQVYAAKESVQAADQLIGDYLPFIRAETAKFLKRPPEEGRDDELSIAMIAFHEAIGGYAKHRGSFLKYASMLIRSRLIDYARKERRHRQTVSLDAPAAGEESASLGETLPEERDHPEESAHRQATRQEIEELSRQMESFGVSLSDVAHAAGLPEGPGLRPGEQLAAGGAGAWEEAAPGEALRRQRRGAENLGAPPEIPGGLAADLHQRV